MTDSQDRPGIVTAAILVIGDEILSGRTKDKNIGYIAEYLTNIGIDLREVRVVADVEADEVGCAAHADDVPRRTVPSQGKLPGGGRRTYHANNDTRTRWRTKRPRR